MNPNKKGFLIPFSLCPMIKALPPENAGMLFFAAMEYAQTGVEPCSLGQLEDIMWPGLKEAIDKDDEAYTRKSVAGRKGADALWAEKKSKRKNTAQAKNTDYSTPEEYEEIPF